jgi:hypothetical protein
MITVNAAGCGKGKSTDNKNLLKKNTSTRFLVIVPSLALADEYKEVGTVVTSDTTNNVKQQIYRAIEANTRVIVITQKAFLDFESKPLLCEHRTVLQDEHLEPFYTCKWQMANHLKWLDMFEVGDTDKDGWYTVVLNRDRANEFIVGSDMLDNKQFIQDLLATPQLIYTNRPAIHAESVLFRVISPAIYEGADAVHITCANFTLSRQYHLWATLFDTTFTVTRVFERYATPNLTIHVAQQRRNSKTYNKADSSVRDSVLAYIGTKCSDPVYVDNNVYDDQSGWQRVQHNCHGVNQFRDQTHVAILSAINYDNLAVAFLMDIAGMTSNSVRESMMGEIAHQVIMRGVLRGDNANVCHVYVMETDLAAYLNSSIFAGSILKVIDGTTRPHRAPPLTAGERKKAALIRKNFVEYQKVPTDKLMLAPIWAMTNTNGMRLKPSMSSGV